MVHQEPQFNIPKVSIYNHYGNVGGSFGDYPLYDTAMGYKSLNEFLNEYGRSVRFKDVCFGPYINFDLIRNHETRSVDDCLVVCDKDSITIYDQTTFDKEKTINIYDICDRQQPIVFEPKLSLYAASKVVDEPKYKAPEQSLVETEVFKIIQSMGFDFISSYTQARFFKPLPKWQKDNVMPDTAFLIKSGKDFYSWYKIYSADLHFEVSYFLNDEPKGLYKIPNITGLIKCLKEDRARRNSYIKQQYIR